MNMNNVIFFWLCLAAGVWAVVAVVAVVWLLP